MAAFTEDQAEVAAQELLARIKSQGVDAGIEELDRALEQFRASGHSIDAILPPEEDGQLGFSLRRARDGKTFWQIYSDLLRDKLCDKDGEFGKLARAGLSGSAGAIVSAIMSSFAFPPAAFSIVVPIAALIAATGIDAFCRFTDES